MQLLGVVWSEVRPDSASEGTKETIIRSLAMKAFKRGLIINDLRWEVIDEEYSSEESFILEF